MTTDPATTLPTLDDIRRAAERIVAYAHRTPVLTCATLDRLTGARLLFKCENLQKGGAFKFRGAANAVFSLSDEEAARGVLTHSSGNHGAALALAARLRGVPSWVVMPEDAPRVKRAAVEGYGARVVSCEATAEARQQTARRLLAETGATFVHPYDDVRVIAGQGTAVLELLERAAEHWWGGGSAEGRGEGGGMSPTGEVAAAEAGAASAAQEAGAAQQEGPAGAGPGREPALDLVVVPVGGGGLAGGTAIATAAVSPATRVVGAEPAAADDAARSMAAGRRIPNPPGPVRTLADGLKTSLAERTFRALHDHGVQVVTVSDDQILAATRLVWERMKIVVEPSAAVPVAALLSGAATALLDRPRDAPPPRVGVLLSGGNVDLDRLEW